MKYLMVSLLSVFFMSGQTLHIPTIPIQSTTHHIQKRFYFIQRLKTTIDLLLKVENNISQFPFLMRTIAWEYNTWQNTFAHSKVENSIKELVSSKHLGPVFTLWNNFADFKALTDECLLEEFIKELFIITKSILINQIQEDVLFKHYPHGVTLCSCLNNAIELSPEQLVDVISLMSQACINECKNIDYLCDEMRETLGLDMHKTKGSGTLSSITTQDILMRFYYIERLLYLPELFKKLESLTGFLYSQEESVFESKLSFTNYGICKTIEEIETTNKSEPLIALLKDFKSYKDIGNKTYTTEVLLVCAIALRNSLLQTSPSLQEAHYKKSDALEGMKEDDLLDFIDNRASQLESLLLENSVKRSPFNACLWYQKAVSFWYSLCRWA